jgi:hypothetical protein
MNLQESIRRILKEEFEEKQVLHIPSLEFFNNDWDLLQRLLEKKGNPPFLIQGNLDSSNTPIESLGNLRSVGKDLDLRYTPIESLGNLKSVGKDLDLNYTPIESLGNLRSVGGFLNLRNTPIKSLGNLRSVGGFLYLYGTPIKSLGNLRSVGKDLDLRYTPIGKKYTEEEIRLIIEVGGDIHL